MEGWMHECMDAWRNGWMHGRTDGCMEGRMDAWKDGWMHGRTDGCMEGRMDAWRDGWMHGGTDAHCVVVRAQQRADLLQNVTDFIL